MRENQFRKGHLVDNFDLSRKPSMFLFHQRTMLSSFAAITDVRVSLLVHLDRGGVGSRVSLEVPDGYRVSQQNFKTLPFAYI